ncbi:MAG: cell division protein CrgA [Bifidobacterium sp.]|jgi:hypothetical protein|nr:cell division protein CrgA [Bifidobacterium sp.]
MADEKLHKTGASDPEQQADWQSGIQDADALASTEGKTVGGAHAAQPSADDPTDAQTNGEDNDDYGVPMDKVEAVLNARIDKASMTPQMRRMVQRQEENTRRVEETIKGAKANPSWFVPLFCTLMVIGLAWAVVYYLTSNYPIPNIGAWNLAIAFTIIMVGFIMTMWWR